MSFNKWIDTLIEEKGFDTDKIIEVEGASGTNYIPLECLIDAIKTAPAHERQAIKTMIVRLDFLNQDIMGYFRHLAQAIAI